MDLRGSTRAAHVAVEEAFALEQRLVSRVAYAELLRALRGFYRPMEAALVAVAGWERLALPVTIAERCRATLLDEDLDQLAEAPPDLGRFAPVPELASLAHGLGCAYVLEGSALGGRIVAGQARAALGADLPVAFFTSAGRPGLGADWRALQAALDAFGAAHGPPARRAAVAAAGATFAALDAWLEAEAPAR